MKFRLTVVTILVLCCVGCFQLGCEQAQSDQLADKVIAEPQEAPLVVPAAAAPAAVKEEPVEPEPVEQQPQGQANIKFDKTTHNFGDSDPGGKQTCSFTFTNTGDSVLKIDKVKAPCGCTVPTLKKKEYAPGESGQIDVTFKAPQKRGSVTKQAFVHSNAKNDSRATLTIKANVVLQVEAEPKKLKIALNDPNLSDPDSDAYVIKLKSSDNLPFAVKSFKTKGDVFTADIDPNKEATEFVIRPKADIEKLKKNLIGQIAIELTHPKCERVAVSYEAIAEFETSPKTILVTNAVELEPQMRTLWITSNYGDDIEIKSTSSEKGSVKTVQQEKKGNRFELGVEITPPARDGKLSFFSDRFHVELENGHKLTLNCRIFYARQEK